MKTYVKEFVRRGLVACGFGPLVLVVFYLLLQKQHGQQALPVNEVCSGIVSLSALAFVAGGMNVVYQIERLPLAVAILIHGTVLYLSYLSTYLFNGWLEWDAVPVFSVIFVLGFLAVWAVIYCVNKKRTAKVNELLKEKQQSAGI